MGPKCCLCPLNNRSGTPLPYFEGTGCEKRDCRDTQIVTHTICNIRMHQNLPFFHEKTAKNGRFRSRIEFVGLRQAVEDPPPILRVLDVKK